MFSFLKRFFSTPSERALRSLQPYLKQILQQQQRLQQQ